MAGGEAGTTPGSAEENPESTRWMKLRPQHHSEPQRPTASSQPPEPVTRGGPSSSLPKARAVEIRGGLHVVVIIPCAAFSLRLCLGAGSLAEMITHHQSGPAEYQAARPQFPAATQNASFVRVIVLVLPAEPSGEVHLLTMCPGGWTPGSKGSFIPPI